MSELCGPCDPEAFNVHTPKSSLPAPGMLSPIQFEYVYYRRLLKTYVTLCQRLDTVYGWRNGDESYAMTCNLAGCTGVMYIPATLQLGSRDHIDKCKHQAGLHFNTYHGIHKPADQRHPSVLRTLGTANPVAGAVTDTALMTFFNGLGLPKNTTVVDDRVPADALYTAIIATDDQHVSLKEQLTPFFSFHLEFEANGICDSTGGGSGSDRLNATEMHTLLCKCLDGTAVVTIYYLRLHADHWRMVVPCLKVNADQAASVINMLRVSRQTSEVKIQSPSHGNKAAVLSIYHCPTELLCYIDGVVCRDESDRLLADKRAFLTQLCVRSPGVASTFSPHEGFPHSADKYAKDLGAGISSDSLRLVWAFCLGARADCCEDAGNQLQRTPLSFRITPRPQSLGGEFSGYCYDATPMGWYDSFCPFAKGDHTVGKISLQVRPESKPNFPVTIIARLHCSNCRRRTDNLSCSDGELGQSVSLRHSQVSEGYSRFMEEDKEKWRIIEHNIHNRMNYPKVRITKIYTDKTGTKYFICVNGDGSSYCLNLRGEHSRTRVWFYLDKAGISQRCFCRCQTSRFKGCCKDFQSHPKPLSDREYGYFFQSKPLKGPGAQGSSVQGLTSQERIYSQKLEDELFGANSAPPPKRTKPKK